MNDLEVAALLGTYSANQPSFCAPLKLRELVTHLLQSAFPGAEQVKGIEYLFGCMFAFQELDLEKIEFAEGERVYVENICKMFDYVKTLGFPRTPPETSETTPKIYDFLASDVGKWSPLKLANLALMMAIPPRQKIAIVTSIRDEGISILEWIAYHRAIGFDKFFVYTNDNNDLSDGLLQKLAEYNIITLIKNYVEDGVNIIVKVTEHSLHFLQELRDYEWALYTDVDEFLVFRNCAGSGLDGFFRRLTEQFGDDLPSAIYFHWKWFGSDNAFERTDGLSLERFLYSRHDTHVKSLIKIKNIISLRNGHVPVLLDGKTGVNSRFSRIDNATPQLPTEYGFGQLNHYWNKSFQEFAVKRNRGRRSSGVGGALLSFKTFFEWNTGPARGNYDPPSPLVLTKTKNGIKELLQLPGVQLELELVEKKFRKMLINLDEKIDLKSTYERQRD